MAAPVLAPAPVEAVFPSMPLANRRAFLGFFFLGFSISIPAVAFPLWNYHLQPPYAAIGAHFLSLAAGALLAGWLNRKSAWVHRLFGVSLSVAGAGILTMEFSGEPLHAAFRHIAFATLGLGLGGLMAATFQSVPTLFRQDPAATVNLAGGMMGLGALIPALLSAIFYAWTGNTGIFAALALAPLACGVLILRKVQPNETNPTPMPAAAVLREFQNPVHVLFAALLFFQTAAELAVTQWAPLHLIVRSGMSPSAALYFLSFYCVALLGGRFLAQAMLARYSHRLLLIASATMAWLGTMIFSFTENGTGASIGLLLSALGFAFVYPLLIERIGSRFREYRPAIFQSIFGLAMLGGFLAPAVIGFWAAAAGERPAMTLPFWCSLLVFALLLLLWVESRISASQAPRS